MLFASKTTLLQSIELAPGPDLSAWPMPDGELVLHFVWCCRWHKHDRLLSSESAPKERNELISRNESTQVVNTVNVLGFVVEIMILMDQTICILSLIKTNRYIFYWIAILFLKLNIPTLYKRVPYAVEYLVYRMKLRKLLFDLSEIILIESFTFNYA